jgi:predicted small metal-binding protein
MAGGSITVRCVCGWEASGPEDEVVAATVDHGQKTHNMTATREQVLAMAVTPAEMAEPPLAAAPEPARQAGE